MKHKTAELEGALLGAAVAKCEGYELDSYGDNLSIRENGGMPSVWNPSIDWSQGGPIINRELIMVAPHGGHWVACCTEGEDCTFDTACAEAHTCYVHAETPLTAAMRAYVSSKFGDEVEL